MNWWHRAKRELQRIFVCNVFGHSIGLITNKKYKCCYGCTRCGLITGMTAEDAMDNRVN